MDIVGSVSVMIEIDGAPMQALAISVFLFGVMVLRSMWQTEVNVIRAPLPLCTLFMATQHIVFSLGGVLISVLGANDTYENLHGIFPLSYGLKRTLVLHFLSLLAALFTLKLIVIAKSKTTHFVKWDLRPGDRRPERDTALAGNQIKNAGMVLLALYFVFILVSFVSGSSEGVSTTNYLANILGRVLPGVFLLFGLHLSVLSKRVRYIVGASIFAAVVIYLPTGGRTGALLPVALFVLGVLVAKDTRKRMKRKVLICGVIVGMILGVISGHVEILRTYYFVRGVPSPLEAIERLEMIVSEAGSDSDWIWGALLGFGARIVELSATSVIEGTPEVIPFAGWPEEAWRDVVDGLLPARFVGGVPLRMEGENFLILSEYGWLIDPYGVHSRPVTLLGDSWRRFGYVGVLGTYASIAAILGILGGAASKRQSIAREVVFGALFSAWLMMSYTHTLVSFWPAMVKNMVVAFILARLAINLLRLKPVSRGTRAAALRWRAKGLKPAVHPQRS